MFLDPVTLRLLTPHFPIPVSTDISFQAETYVAWVVLRSMVAGVTWVMAMGDYTDRGSSTFCDSLSYIIALLGKNKYDLDNFVSSMIRACRDLITFWGCRSLKVCPCTSRARCLTTSWMSRIRRRRSKLLWLPQLWGTLWVSNRPWWS